MKIKYVSVNENNVSVYEVIELNTYYPRNVVDSFKLVNTVN